MMKHSSHQFGDKFSGFGHQSEKFSCIGTCIKRNFAPCTRRQAFQPINIPQTIFKNTKHTKTSKILFHSQAPTIALPVNL